MPKIRLTGSRLLFCDWETENCWGEVQNIRGLILAQYTSKNDLEVIHSLWGCEDQTRASYTLGGRRQLHYTPVSVPHQVICHIISRGPKSPHTKMSLWYYWKNPNPYSELLASQLHLTAYLVSWVWLSRKGTAMFPLYLLLPIHPCQNRRHHQLFIPKHSESPFNVPCPIHQ